MCAVIINPGTCTWTYHPPGAGETTGHWTVVSHCLRGKKCSAGGDAALLTNPAGFAAAVRKEYAVKGETLTKEQEKALDEHAKAKASQAEQSFDMPCV